MSAARPSPIVRGRADQGMALFGVIVILSTLAMVGVTVYSVVSTQVTVSGHHKFQQQAFHQADAGVQYVKARLAQDIRDGVVTLSGSNVAVNYAPPAGLNFDPVTNLTRLANPNLYLIRVTGRANTASTRIEAVLGRRNALGGIGVFGDRRLDIQPGFEIYSYDSRDTTNPSPLDSTGRATVGSNEVVDAQPGTGIDGTVLLGQSSSGTQAVYSGPGSIPRSEVPRIDPDPLGAIGGPLADSFSYYSSGARNDNGAAGITGNRIRINAHQTETLSSGTYYVNEIEIGAHATLDIQSTPADPVVIFLTGEFDTQPSSHIVSSSGSPRGLYIYSNSNDQIRIQPNSSFRGIIYAPYADLRIQPNGILHGIFWASNTLLQPSGDLYVDTAGLDDFLSGNLALLQWKEAR